MLATGPSPKKKEDEVGVSAAFKGEDKDNVWTEDCLTFLHSCEGEERNGITTTGSWVADETQDMRANQKCENDVYMFAQENIGVRIDGVSIACWMWRDARVSHII